MRMIDADRLLEFLRYNKDIHIDVFSDTYQLIAIDIDALIQFIENEVKE